MFTTAGSATILSGLCKFNIKSPSFLNLFLKIPLLNYGFLLLLKIVFTFAMES